MKKLLISGLAMATLVTFSGIGMAKPDLKQMENKANVISEPVTIMTDQEKIVAEQAEIDALPESLQMIDEPIENDDIPTFPSRKYKGIASEVHPESTSFSTL